MFSNERYSQILKYLEDNDTVSVQELSRRLFASPSTIRRDLSELEKQGILRRVHGGAMLTSGSNYDSPAASKRCQQLAEKQKIAELAVRFLKPSTSYFFDSSTTTAVFAPKVANFPNSRIVTNGIEIPSTMSDTENISIVQCGGYLRAPWAEFIGNITLTTIANMNADVFFFSAAGFSLEQGATEFSDDHVSVKKAFLANSKLHILLCDSTKFGKCFFFNSVSINEIDYIITDRRPPAAYVELLGSKLIYE